MFLRKGQSSKRSISKNTAETTLAFVSFSRGLGFILHTSLAKHNHGLKGRRRSERDNRCFLCNGQAPVKN